jgi:hypothetical protein
MASLNDDICKYTTLLGMGQIQRAYRGILSFMSDFKAYLEQRHPGYGTGALYFGYMDMTYFSFTPISLKERKLKIAVVYLHEECAFELWLAGGNRQVQADYIALLAPKELGKYRLSAVAPGVDSIVSFTMVQQPDFDHPEELKKQIEAITLAFIADMESMLAGLSK